jgi:hypothetical protein
MSDWTHNLMPTADSYAAAEAQNRVCQAWHRTKEV